tara:strand:- start:6896 stop:8752 length:1857 start_codon:yes stop_codon:yes gene_type:complete
MGQTKGGLGQMLQQAGEADADVLEAVEMVESMPGGMELLYTMAAEDIMKKGGASKKDAKKVRLYCYGGAVEKAYAKGGSVAAAAEKTRAAGRGDDSMMLHVSPEEYETIEAMWGKAEINPNTGIGEYGFLSKIWKKVKGAVKKIFKSKIFQVVAPIALSIFVPGLGAAIGGMLAGGASATAQAVIGNALLRGGLSAAGGGDFTTGAISGAISGGLGSAAGSQVSKVLDVSDSTANLIGASLASGAGAELTGGDFASGAMQGALGQMMQPTMEGLTAKGQDMFGIEDPGAGGIMAVKKTPAGAASPIEGGGGKELISLDPQGGAAPQMSPVPEGSMQTPEDVFGTYPAGPAGAPPAAGTPAAAPAAGGDGKLDMDTIIKYGLPAMAALGATSGSPESEPIDPYSGGNFNEDLPFYEQNRQFTGIDPNAYYTYGQPGAQQSAQQQFVTPTPFGGPAAGPAGGLGNQNDEVGALIEQGAPVPFQIVRGGGARLVNAGYTKDTNTGAWMPPPPELGQGMGQAAGGYQESADRFVRGAGTGRSDDIPARLSDGEYVMDAESVALLGDGSGDAGAKRLDEMRTNLRKHKGKNLSKGGFSHKAKAPANYMSGGGMARLRAAAGRA